MSTRAKTIRGGAGRKKVKERAQHRVKKSLQLPPKACVLMKPIVTTMTPIKSQLPKEAKKIGPETFVTLDAVAAGKRQEANPTSKIPSQEKFSEEAMWDVL
jgi:hypothetical protein